MALAFVASSANVLPPTAITISGFIQGSPGRYAIQVSLWDARGFLRNPVQVLHFAAGAGPRYRFVTSPGRWVVSAFEDHAGNGVLEMGIFGPKEPSGFWRSFSGWHKPRFDELATDCEKSVDDADISLK